VQIIPDHKSEKVTKIGAWLKKVIPKTALAFMEFSDISNVSNSTK